jgi:Flp pilus assembly secretin CpaC
VLWLTRAGLACGDDAIRILSFPASPPTVEQAQDAVNPDGNGIVIQLLIVELRGDIQRALKEAGFRESASGNHNLSGTGLRRERDSQTVNALLKIMSAHAEVDVLSRPQVRTLIGQSANIQVGTAPPRIPYLVRTGTKSFELREAASGTPLGITINLTPRAGDDSEQIEISPLQISTTTLDGREQIPGLDLDVGKPIVSTRTLETSITLIDGAEASAITLPGPPGRQPILFLTARRMKRTAGSLQRPAETQPLQVEKKGAR